MKYHEIMMTKESARIAGLKAVIDLVEYLADIDEVVETKVNIQDQIGYNLYANITVKVLGDVDQEITGLEKIVEGKPLTYRIEKIIVEEQGQPSIFSEEILEIYDEVITLSHRLLARLLQPYLNRKYEYFATIISDGKIILLEGEEEKVYVPIPSHLEPIVTAHTHPHTPCIPSKRDIESLIRLLVDQGIGLIILSPLCNLIIYRRGLFLEEDYETLLKLSREIGKNKDVVNAVRTINKYSKKLKNIKIVMM